MIGLRILWMLIIAIAAGIASAWLAARPGALRLRWLGWEVETSIAAIIMLLALVLAVFLLARYVMRLVLR